MKKYFRSNVVMAEPMNLGAYNAYRGWKLPENETGKEEGYHLVYAAGYESWCPKAEFEKVSREINCMTFGQAIEALKLGNRVTRKGWNGRNMWLIFVPANRWSTSIGPHYVENAHTLPWIGMKTVDGGLVPWLASQSDILEEDWQLVE